MPDQKEGGISWTNTTWNPIVGCSRVSQGCVRCYAETMAARVANAAQWALQTRQKLTDVQAAYRQVVRWERGGMDPADEMDKALPKWNGRVAVIESRLNEPLQWKRPRLVFTNSMSDLFHESLTFEQIDQIVAVMALARQHTFQVLTKRPERMAAYLNDPDTSCRILEAARVIKGTSPLGRLNPPIKWPLPNVHWGVSAEDQPSLDKRLPHLLACRPHAAVLWLSLEPLLGPVTLTARTRDVVPGAEVAIRAFIDWVVVGGESGHGARPMLPTWARQLRDECRAAGVSFHFKQWGEWTPGENVEQHEGKVPVVWYRPNSLLKDPWILGQEDLAKNEGHVDDEPDLYRVGKKAAGRLLDGVLHDAMPAMAGR